jgi:hypothetical protein
MELPATKRCSKCGEVKAREEFFADVRKKDGKYTSCKACDKLRKALRCAYDIQWCKNYNAAYYAANSEKIKTRNLEYQRANPEKTKVRAAAYRKRNPEKRRFYKAAYRARQKAMREFFKMHRAMQAIAEALKAATSVLPLPSKP